MDLIHYGLSILRASQGTGEHCGLQRFEHEVRQVRDRGAAEREVGRPPEFTYLSVRVRLQSERLAA